MTPQEAADLVITCTATGRSGLPLWSFLPGMFIKSALDVTHPDHHEPGRVLHVARGASVLGVCDVDGELIQVDARVARPDFTDALTVQALYLLVVRAWHAASYAVTLQHLPGGHITLYTCEPVKITLPIWHHTRAAGMFLAPHVMHYGSGPDYAIFANALAHAPIKDAA